MLFCEIASTCLSLSQRQTESFSSNKSLTFYVLALQNATKRAENVRDESEREIATEEFQDSRETFFFFQRFHGIIDILSEIARLGI